VAEAVEGLSKKPFVIVAPELPNGRKAGGHLSLADASGDSAIFEYLGGKLVIHHDRKYTVMTNSPTFDQQLAINTYWKCVNGLNFQPGTIGSADRFVRMSWSLGAAPKEKDPRLAVATAFSLIRSISVPLASPTRTSRTSQRRSGGRCPTPAPADTFSNPPTARRSSGLTSRS
jgi:penicillin V acylase-like amidase (Ntn superfamily)